MNNYFDEVQIAGLATRLCDGIVRHANGSPNNRPWTAAVYQTLRELSETEKWKIFPKDKPCRGEYLCDFMLFEEGYGCRIACESQWWWDTDPLQGLDWAFDKLRGVKSDLKLFIFEGQDGNFETLVRKYLERNAQINLGEAFLALRWSKGHFENSFWIAPRAGVQTEAITFTPLGSIAAGIPDFVTDKHGNNLAVRCPKCQNTFIISELLNRTRARLCPHCDQSMAGFRNGLPFIEDRH